LTANIRKKVEGLHRQVINDQKFLDAPVFEGRTARQVTSTLANDFPVNGTGFTDL
jgi:hypothetical protein